ncbi:phasin family protein [Candidatus Magnetaquicoccus inordinatus]|uniref:phasin family protein n=1 Tax=Candidatus Magnetaquicoccus inordinatus TaxID=2496818 RepID=UPI00102BD08E|nr:phasin family protein [Candidatus Magnetaquicoccus inordinatus]
MDGNLAKQIMEANSKMLNTLTGLQKINERIMKELAERQLNNAETLVKAGSGQINSLAGLKTVEDVAQAQAGMVAEMGQLIVDNARQTLDLLSRSQAEVNEFIEKNVHEMVDQVKSQAS